MKQTSKKKNKETNKQKKKQNKTNKQKSITFNPRPPNAFADNTSSEGGLLQPLPGFSILNVL